MFSIAPTIKSHLPFVKFYSIDFVDKAFYSFQSQNREYTTKAPKIIYAFWTEDNPLTENRIRSIQTIQENCGVEFKLITKETLPQYELSKHPFHPAFKYLSAVHKSDYLRTYFMHFYGGGYTDIKPQIHNWESLFNKVNQTPYVLCAGYPEKKITDIARIKDFIDKGNKRKLNSHLKRNYNKLIGNGAYIFKPQTPFTKLWITECERRLSIAFEDLLKNPGNLYGNNIGYPLPWTSILGQIFHPLSFVFNERVIKSDNLRPVCKNYR